MFFAISFSIQQRRFILPQSFLRLQIGLLLVIGCIGVVPRAFAKPTFPAVVTDAYHPKAGGKVAGAAQSCQLCHTGPPKLNVYGADVKAALRKRTYKNADARQFYIRWT